MFVIAQISDSHLSAGKPFFVANFDCVRRAIAARGADLVVNTGDITLNGADEEADFVAARQLHDGLGLPWRAVPGNHDVGDTPAVVAKMRHHPQLVDPERLARYRRHFGAEVWLQDLPGWRLVGFNALILGSGLAAEREQEAALAESFATAGERRILLFGHKPFCDRSLDETAEGGRFLHPGPRQRLLQVLGGRAPAVIACGHVHQFRRLTVGDSLHVWGPSTGYVLPDHVQPRYGTRDIGYVEHRLYTDGRHDCAYLRPGEAETLVITDFPQAYGAM